MERPNSRRRERVRSDAVAKLRWNTATGVPRFATGKILDCTETGLRVETAEPIPLRSYLAIDSPELRQTGWAGWGSVRYCIHRQTKYVVGVELTAGARWN